MTDCSCTDHQKAYASQVAVFLDGIDRLRAALTHSTLAVALQGAEIRQINTGGKDSLAATAGGRLMGWSVRETAGAQATVYLRDGTDSSGLIIAPIELAPNESTRDSYFPGGLSFVNGLFVDVVAGQVEGAVFLGGNAP